MKLTSSKRRTIIINETRGRAEDKNEAGGKRYAEAGTTKTKPPFVKPPT